MTKHALVLVASTLVLSLVGCASTCPECVPDVQYRDVNMAVGTCAAPPAREPLVLPTKPTPPAEDASPEEFKDWWAAMSKYVKVTVAVLENRIELLEKYLDAYDEKN
jgi:hypothetical protein